MKNSKWLIIALAFLSMAFYTKLNAQDFGVKGLASGSYLFGGGFHMQLDNLNYSPESRLNDFACGQSVYVKGEIRKYFGTSGLYFAPNIRISAGYEWWGSVQRYNEGYSYRCFNSNIIPAIGLGYDYKIYNKNKGDGFFADGLFLGVGFWNEFVFGSKLIQNKSRYKLFLENPYACRLAIVAGLRGGWRDFEIDMDFICGIGNPFKIVEGVYDNVNYKLNSPIFCVTLGVMKKFYKY